MNHLKPILAAVGFVSSVALAQTATADVTGLAGWLELLKSGGPLTFAVIAGWVAWRKDSEAKESQRETVEMAKKTQNEMITMVSSLTGAITLLEATLDDLKDAVKDLKGKD